MQVIADPGRVIWASPALAGACHDLGASREHGLIDGLNAAGVRVVADTAYQGGGPRSGFPSADDASTPLPAATGVCLSRKKHVNAGRKVRAGQQGGGAVNGLAQAGHQRSPGNWMCAHDIGLIRADCPWSTWPQTNTSRFVC